MPALLTRVRVASAAALGLAVALALVLGLGVVSCGAQRPVLAPVDPKLRATTTTASALIPTSDASSSLATTAAPIPAHKLLAASPATMQGLIATPVGDPVVHKSAKRASALIPVPKASSLGVKTVFAVVGDDSGPWIQVLLPTRPNGATGWVQRSRVRVTKSDIRVFVNLRRRLLTVNRANRTVMQTRIAIGTVANPTPTGATYITELLDTGKPDGPYGSFAFGLGLHSDTLSEFAGGNGQAGIHGTNAPQLIGQRVSHGCVRLSNRDIVRLVSYNLALGTPVFVR